MGIALSFNAINQKLFGQPEPFCTVLESRNDFNRCINCPALSLACVKKIFDTSIEHIKASNYRIVYVVNGKIKLCFPHKNTETCLLDHHAMLIATDAKFVIENDNPLPANFVVRDLKDISKKSRKAKCCC